MIRPRTETALEFHRTDGEVWTSIDAEADRQERQLELIASENHASAEVIAAMGTVLTNKYAEGYPGRRYYGGCEHVDDVENLARNRAKALFGAGYANVQPHSGTQANMGALMALCEPGDRVLGMSLDHGGHLSHGHPRNFSGIFYEFHSYGVERESERIDFDEVRRRAQEGPSPGAARRRLRLLPYHRLRRLRRDRPEVDAKLMVDMAHIAGLVAAGAHPLAGSPRGRRHDDDPQDLRGPPRWDGGDRRPRGAQAGQLDRPSPVVRGGP